MKRWGGVSHNPKFPYQKKLGHPNCIGGGEGGRGGGTVNFFYASPNTSNTISNTNNTSSNTSNTSSNTTRSNTSMH